MGREPENVLTSMDCISQLGLILVRLEESKGGKKGRKSWSKNRIHHIETVEMFKLLLITRTKM